MENPEKDALTALLEAVDRGAADLADKLAARPRDGRFFELLTRHDLLDEEVRLLLVALSSRLSGKAALTGADTPSIVGTVLKAVTRKR